MHINQDFTTIFILSLITNVIILLIGTFLDADDSRESTAGYAFSICLALFSLGLLVVSFDMFGFPFPNSSYGYESFLTLLCLVNPFSGIFVLAKFAKNDFKSPSPPLTYIDKYNYKVRWSEEDNEYIATCSGYKSLSWLAESPGEAFNGILKTVAEVEKDLTGDKS